jgi:putative SOS response-associated peptidase YedK
MPVILDSREAEALWLDPEVDAQEALHLLRPYPAELMRAKKASRRVNDVRNDDPSVLNEKAADACLRACS